MTDQHDIASCAAELPRPPALDDAPGQWVHLLTLGTIQGRDGRGPSACRGPDQVLNRFLTGGVDLVVDFEHAAETPQPKGTPVPAAGWIKPFEPRADGIWGLVEWTERAAKMVRAKEYRTISPTFLARRADQEIIVLQSAGLGRIGRTSTWSRSTRRQTPPAAPRWPASPAPWACPPPASKPRS